MPALYLIAEITPRAERIDEALEAFRALVQATLREPGCELYDLVVETDRPDTWLMVEKWASREAWEAHMQTEHVISHNARAEAFLSGPATLRFYDPV